MSDAAVAWANLERVLARLRQDRKPLAPPPGGRVGAALVLLAAVDDGLEVIYTRRRDELRSHPGQISFPGGRVDPGETVEQAAIREAMEEVALHAASATVVGRLPSFYVPPSRMWLQPVLARWDAPHALVAAEAEVAAILPVRLARLRDPETWRAVRVSTAGWSWAWQLDERNLLWGATGVVTALLLDLLHPGWTRGHRPDDLPDDRRVQPMLRADAAPRIARPARLAGVREQGLDALAPPAVDDAPDRPAAALAAIGVAEAVQRLGDSGRVLVLAGPGWTGRVGIQTAARLRAAGRRVEVLQPRATAGAAGAGRDAGDASAGAPLDEDLAVFDGTLPPADVVVDALVGRGLTGSLRGTAAGIVHALRYQAPTVIAVDLPSGLHPVDGLVGELLPADVTVAVGRPAPALFRPGLGPFVGDLYVADPGGAPLVRIVPGADGARWRSAPASSGQ